MSRAWLVLGVLGLVAPFAGGCGAGSEPTGGNGGSGAGDNDGGSVFQGGNGGMGFGGSSSSGPVDVCKVNDADSDNAVTPCVEVAPADAFAPEVQWEWTAPAPSQFEVSAGRLPIRSRGVQAEPRGIGSRLP